MSAFFKILVVLTVWSSSILGYCGVVEKNIHFIWVGKKIKSSYLESIETISKGNSPLYRTRVWTDDIDNIGRDWIAKTGIEVELIKDHPDLTPNVFLKRIINTEMGKTIFNESFLVDKYWLPNFAAASDILRVLILNKYGGIYLDTDVTSSFVPFGELEAKHGLLFKFVICEDGRKQIAENSIMAGTAHSDTLDKLESKIAENYRSFLDEGETPSLIMKTLAQETYYFDLDNVNPGNFWNYKLAPTTIIKDLNQYVHESRFVLTMLISGAYVFFDLVRDLSEQYQTEFTISNFGFPEGFVTHKSDMNWMKDAIRFQCEIGTEQVGGKSISFIKSKEELAQGGI